MSRKSKAARQARRTPPANQVLFSEMIDEWLRAGERLSDPSPPDGTESPQDRVTAATGSGSTVMLDGWRSRAGELWRAIIERHRLEALVAVGLVPLMLWLAMLNHPH